MTDEEREARAGRLRKLCSMVVSQCNDYLGKEGALIFVFAVGDQEAGVAAMGSNASPDIARELVNFASRGERPS